MENAADKPGQCSRCGKPLSKDAAEGLCAACLLAAAAESLTYTAGDAPTEWGGDSSEAGDGISRLVAGQAWGPYSVGRLLGRGGMGEVYEAEHMRSGRRLAVKVLRSRLQNADERARFLREGQLAASISHPHTVYIFGSEEISGTPVISMELTPGGTLKDRVASKGPLAPAEAASAVLDIIGGLDAAQSVGILHRDIKPSNCFVDSLGNIKVGDFGLSISTLARDVQDDVSGPGFQGTPQFASPEQLRGEPLDVRSDIYAVGATFYYLLTGQPPFEANNLRELVERVTMETPRSPRLVRPGIPSALANVVLNCLAKTPAERPASYAALADALRPFTLARHEPARLGVRFFAGMIDSLIAGLSLPLLAMLFGAVGGGNDTSFSDSFLLGWINAFIYFLMEGISGATPGKRILGLRVRTAGGGIAPWSRIVCRHFVFNLPSVVWTVAIAVVGAARINEFAARSTLFIMLMSFSTLTVTAMLFLTARRTNGWAAIHDLASGTRIVLRSRAASPRATASAGAVEFPGAQLAAAMNYGPFRVLSDAGPADEGRLFVGFDPALRRRVWIQTHPTGTAEISAARRDASRTGRLHWLTGRRSGDENWDAFEAPDGESLSAHRGRTAWATLKLWLLDLANELHTAAQERTLPALALDRLWIRSDGRLVLLDFPATGISSTPPAALSNGSLTPVRLLSAVAEFCLPEPGGPHSLPLRARMTIDRWTAPDPPELAEARASLVDLSSAADHTSKLRRAIVIGLTAIPFLIAIGGPVGTVLGTRASLSAEQRKMLLLLQVADDDNPVYRAAVEQYLAAHHRSLLQDDAFWRRLATDTMTGQNTPAMRELAADIAARYPSVPEADAIRAEQVIARRLELIRRLENPVTAVAQGVGVFGIIMTILIVVWGLIWSAILPGGPLLRATGLAVVTRDGREISRLRSAARVLITWAAPLVCAIGLWVYAEIVTRDPFAYTLSWGIGGIYLLPAIGALWTLAHPTQGLHDRLASTWVVPR